MRGSWPRAPTPSRVRCARGAAQLAVRRHGRSSTATGPLAVRTRIAGFAAEIGVAAAAGTSHACQRPDLDTARESRLVGVRRFTRDNHEAGQNPLRYATQLGNGLYCPCVADASACPARRLTMAESSHCGVQGREPE